MEVSRVERRERGGRRAAAPVTPPDGTAARVVLTAQRCEVHVPTPDDGDVIVDVCQRRPDVVARLLAMGVSEETLMTLLPDWESLIREIAARDPSVR